MGLLCCIKCSGVHRSLGVNVSKVRSLTLDSLEPEVLLLLAGIGNKKVNMVYEAKVPPTRSKPTRDSPEYTTHLRIYTYTHIYTISLLYFTLYREERAAWIRDKYVNRLFLGDYEGTEEQHIEDFKDACMAEDLGQMIYHIAHGASVGAFCTEGGAETLLHMAAKNELVLSSTFLVLNSATLDV